MCERINNPTTTGWGAGTGEHVRVRRRPRPTSTTAMLVQVTLSCLIVSIRFSHGTCFVPGTMKSSLVPRQHQIRSDGRSNNDDIMHSATGILSGTNNDDDDADWRQRVDEFLDKPFFDPDDEAARQDAEEGGFKTWFARLVINDYATAEALYAGIFFSLLLLATQEALRYYMYGVDYVPFSRGGGGKLF